MKKLMTFAKSFNEYSQPIFTKHLVTKLSGLLVPLIVMLFTPLIAAFKHKNYIYIFFLIALIQYSG